ncbi:MAG: nuclear transport factor 2 family protein [Aliidongia sp.]
MTSSLKSIVRGLLLIPVLMMAGAASPADTGADASAFFLKFMAAQNAHDIPAVRSMLWDAPGMLWYTRGSELRGADAVAEKLRDYYQGTWHLEPDMTHFEATAMTGDVVQILVPILFTRGPAGGAPQENRFLISQTFVRVAAIGRSPRSFRSPTRS